MPAADNPPLGAVDQNTAHRDLSVAQGLLRLTTKMAAPQSVIAFVGL